MRSVKCGLWSFKCEVWSVDCEVWSVECEVWSLEFEECSVKCGVWRVKTLLPLSLKKSRLSREVHGRDRVSSDYRSFIFGKLPPPACPGLCSTFMISSYLLFQSYLFGCWNPFAPFVAYCWSIYTSISTRPSGNLVIQHSHRTWPNIVRWSTYQFNGDPIAQTFLFYQRILPSGKLSSAKSL